MNPLMACTERILQANLGFPHYVESFDVVHARAVSAGVRLLLDASPAFTNHPYTRSVISLGCFVN